jgi:1,4-dihydroxy-6-naphthoate synthase
LTLCPGGLTTATLLFEIFHAGTTRIEQCLFSEIMPRLSRGEADFGVCIHEGRFTWQHHGLAQVEDLGERWESLTGLPLPLGGLVVRRGLSNEVASRVQSVIRDSIEFALDRPQSALPTMRRHAQELDDGVLMKHVELYVNQWTRELSDVGRESLDRLSDLARQVGLVEPTAQPLRVFEPDRPGTV